MQIADYRHLQWAKSSNSSGGMYLKATYKERGVLYYYKLSDYSYGRFKSHEAVLEVIVSRLGICLGLPVLKYTGIMADIQLDGQNLRTYVSKSKNYCSATQTAMSARRYYELYGTRGETHLAFCRRIGLGDYIDKLLIFDYLIMNTDRHGFNIEILINSDNTISPAPIFDNGRCLTYARGNLPQYIKMYDYKVAGEGNNFIGTLDLEKNLRNVSHKVKLPQLTNEIRKKVFYGLGGVMAKEHMNLIWDALCYRYGVLRSRGVII